MYLVEARVDKASLLRFGFRVKIAAHVDGSQQCELDSGILRRSNHRLTGPD